MTDIQFTDLADISGIRVTADGYMVGQVRCARTGCQTYMATDIGLPGSGTVSVYRPPEVVFAKDSLATFAGKPVCMGHPPEMVTSDNWRTYAVGDIGTEIARDGEFVSVPYKIMDAAAIKAVQDGTRQISMGYTTGLSIEDGVAPDGTPYQVVQTGPIRINHLAIVPQARGGSNLRIGDGADASAPNALAIGDGITAKDGMEQPLHYWVPSIAPSGMAFYSGDKFPNWKGNLLVGALRDEMLVRLELNGEKVVREERLLKGQVGRIRDVRVGLDGLVYLLTDERDGAVVRLEAAK